MTEIRPVVWTGANKETTQIASNVTINANSSQTFSLTIPPGKTGMAITINVTYNSSATAGATIQIFYSQDGVNFDTVTSEVDNLSFTAGATVQQTFTHPCITPYANIVVTNKDTSQALTLNSLWVTYI